MLVAKVAWEVENRACELDDRVWPLHPLWHFLSALAAYYGVVSTATRRFECGAAPGEAAALPLRWAFVPFDRAVRAGRAAPSTPAARRSPRLVKRD